MVRCGLVLVVALCLTMSVFPTTAQLRPHFYIKSCPNVEQIVRNVVLEKVKQTFITIPATLRLFFHDCFVNGCDASIIIQSTPNNKAEKDHPDNVSLVGDGFDVVVKAKKALDAISSCKNKVSCADILALATRDVILAAGGPSYQVELGRFDGLVSTAASVEGRLPGPNDNLNKLSAIFKRNKLTLDAMIALSAAHTIGFTHCSKVFNRIYNFNRTHSVDPILNKTYAKELQLACPKKVDPRTAINMDPVTPRKFDNSYFKKLRQGKGLFTSDQVLFADDRTRPFIHAWANDSLAFNRAFVISMRILGRVGIKTSREGNIRRDCRIFN